MGAYAKTGLAQDYDNNNDLFINHKINKTVE